ncbi:YbaN family protein [Desulfosediminicola sp.]|uniref:YbaN family protein n=1 Tax=Desulfosediminicola sp. TaxID=2886825 RepID=UPI003AF2F676
MTKISRPIIRYLTAAAAYTCIGLGVLGVFLPVLPTVPFFILATILSFRSSPKLRRWLLRHPQFGEAIRNFLRDKSISGRILRRALITLWAGLTISCLLVPHWWLRAMLVSLGGAVTLYLLSLSRIGE